MPCADARRATGEREPHGRRARFDRRAVWELELAEGHVHVRVHILDRARDGGQRLAHEERRGVDLVLGNDRVRLEVRDTETRAAAVR